MKKEDFKFVSIISVLLIIIIAATILLSVPKVYLGPDDGTTSTRSFFPSQALINSPLTVNLQIDAIQQTPFIDIIQSIPDGFQIIYGGISINRPDLSSHFGTEPIQLLKFGPLTDETLSYVLIPQSTVLCPNPPSSIEIDTLYLAPPEGPRAERGQQSIPIAAPSVTRTLSKPSTVANGQQTVYLTVYPQCEISYILTETIPTEDGWTVTDAGEGEMSSENVIIWNIDCPEGPCPSKVFSYKIGSSNPSVQSQISGTYIFSSGQEQTISGTNILKTEDIDCTTPDSCNNDACEGEYCNADQTASCFEQNCVGSCTDRGENYLCSPSCDSPDRAHPQGDPECTTGICCQDIPTQTCEQIGGYCTQSPVMACPPGLTRLSLYEPSCNGNEIPLVGNHKICCTSASGGGGGGGGGGPIINPNPIGGGGGTPTR